RARARCGSVDAEDRGHRDPADADGAHDAGRRPARAAGRADRRRPGVRSLRRGARATLLQLSQDDDLRRVERDPAQHHREARAATLASAGGRRMDFGYSDEQRQLADSIRRFVERHYDFEARRRIVESPEGWSSDVWRRVAELGVLALPLPVECGGFGGGAVDLMPFMNAVGEALMVEPFVATLVAARVVARSASGALHRDLLRAVSEGRS